jgi:hypothetical protein
MTLVRRAAPIAMLALLGAASPATDVTAAATCTLGQAQTEAAFRALPLISTEDDTEADERGTIYSFGGAELWGTPATRVRFSNYANPNAGEYSQRYETAFSGDFGQTLVRFLVAHGKKKCDREIGTTCELALAPDGKWNRVASLTLILGGGSETRDPLEFMCAFTKRG